MQLKKRISGQAGEDFAAEYLRRRGYKILTRNYREYQIGEIDIIAHKGSTLAIVEVKSRSSDTYGKPSEAVTYDKQRKLIKTAELFKRKFIKNGTLEYTRKIWVFNVNWHCNVKNIRFDVAEVSMTKDSELININYIESAFGGWKDN
jgi:putative endonuclease